VRRSGLEEAAAATAAALPTVVAGAGARDGDPRRIPTPSDGAM
jgi:hypothetical protein